MTDGRSARHGGIAAGQRVLIIVPAYNEEGSVGDVVRDILHHLPEATPVVIDDGSTDTTGETARAAGARVIRMPFNMGIGTAVQTGFKLAERERFDVAVQVDGDGQHPPSQVRPLLEEMARTDANYVIGSRFLEETSYRAPLARRGGIRLLARLVSTVTRQRITDTTSGLRAADSETIRLFALHYPHDYPEVEAIVLAKRAGLTVREVVVHMKHRESGQSSITPFKSLYYMVKVTLAVLVQFAGRNPAGSQ